MPDTLEAATTFALVIAPGYQLVRGYAVARGADAPSKDLYVLAQTVVASLAWLGVTWILVEDLLRWVSKDTVSDHFWASLAILPLMVGLPYAVGRVTGVLAKAVMRPRRPLGPSWLQRLLRGVGLGGQETAWDQTWRKVLMAGRGVITAELGDGRSIVGQFASESFVATSPAVPAVYFERAYELQDDGSAITYAGGAYLDGDQVVALKFNEIG